MNSHRARDVDALLSAQYTPEMKALAWALLAAAVAFNGRMALPWYQRLHPSAWTRTDVGAFSAEFPAERRVTARTDGPLTAVVAEERSGDPRLLMQLSILDAGAELEAQVRKSFADAPHTEPEAFRLDDGSEARRWRSFPKKGEDPGSGTDLYAFKAADGRGYLVRHTPSYEYERQYRRIVRSLRLRASGAAGPP